MSEIHPAWSNSAQASERRLTRLGVEGKFGYDPYPFLRRCHPMVPTYALLLAAVLAVQPGPPAELSSDFAAAPVNVPIPGTTVETARCLKGRLRVLDEVGRFSPAEGDLYVMLQADGVDAKANPFRVEVLHFDADTLDKLRTLTGRKGEYYALLLPWPPGWPEGVEVEMSLQFKPSDGGPQVVSKLQPLRAKVVE